MIISSNHQQQSPAEAAAAEAIPVSMTVEQAIEAVPSGSALTRWTVAATEAIERKMLRIFKIQ